MMESRDKVIIPKNKKDKVINDLNEPVGLRLEQDQQGEHFEFYFPPKYLENSQNNDKKSLFDYKDDIMKLLRLIDKFRDNDSFNRGEQNNFLPIYSCLWVVNDYIINGVYKETEKYYANDISGKISWKSTIKKVMPFVNDGKLVYPKFNVERLRQIDNELFVKIQIYCVNLATNIVGWYFGIQPQKFIEYKKDDEQLKYFIKYLMQKKQETFLDYKKMLIDCLLSILKEVHQSGNIFSSVFTDSFHTVFENLVVEIFSNINKEDRKDFYPSSKWFIGNDTQGKSASNLRPDAIYIDDNKLFIIDAKYYNYGYQIENDEDKYNTNELPQTADISKQVRYAEYVKEKFKANNYLIYNIFILPTKFEDDIKFIGYNMLENDKSSDESYSKVYAFQIGLKKLVDAYYNIENYKSLRKECYKCINEIISK